MGHTCHSLWFWRNNKLHNDDYVFPASLAYGIRFRVGNYKDGINYHQSINIKKYVFIDIKWRLPSPDWIQVKVDGVVTSNRKAGNWGLLQDHASN